MLSIATREQGQFCTLGLLTTCGICWDSNLQSLANRDKANDFLLHHLGALVYFKIKCKTIFFFFFFAGIHIPAKNNILP